jgi:hypothetical protein
MYRPTCPGCPVLAVPFWLSCPVCLVLAALPDCPVPIVPLSCPFKFCQGWLVGSVADPGCLSRIRIFPHPGSRIPKTWGGKKKNFIYLFSYLFVAFRSCWNRSWLITVAQNLFNLITILNYFHFLTQENIGFKLSEIMVGSGIRKKNYSGSRIQG